MHTQLSRTSSAILISLALGACGAARLVERTPYGGVVALQGDRSMAMQQAQPIMDAQCGAGNYTIVREWEQAVGTESTGRQDVRLSDDGTGTLRGAGTGHVETRDVTEWRLEFQCGAGSGPPGAAGATRWPRHRARRAAPPCRRPTHEREEGRYEVASRVPFFQGRRNG